MLTEGDLRDAAPGDEVDVGGWRGAREEDSLPNGYELPDRFTKATAAATGQSERVIQRAVARGRRSATISRGAMRHLVCVLQRELIVGPETIDSTKRRMVH